MTAHETLDLYGRASGAVAETVLRAYSTSFSLACRLLPVRMRAAITNVYGLVRIADEIVDGAAAQAGLSADDVHVLLDRLEQDTERAMRCGYSANPVVHAFAGTARCCGIDRSLTAPFFSAMRTDLSIAAHTRETLDAYVYGSAEVVGLMCLRVFVHHGDMDIEAERLEYPAQSLGAAFQKINFLRDLHADADGLGRSYFPGVTADTLDETTKKRLICEIREDLAAAEPGIALLPRGPRRAVGLAHALFSTLTDKIDEASAGEIARRRVRVSDCRKALLALQVLAVPRLRPGTVPGAPLRHGTRTGRSAA